LHVSQSNQALSFTHSTDRSSKRYNEALRILPYLLEQMPLPEKVVDVGGGQGAWSRASLELGVEDVISIDHPDTKHTGLVVDEKHFLGYDLSKGFPSPIRADLCLCLEVAEHLPESQAPDLVNFLTGCSRVILFSAAIPGQPGDHHINCQPPAYWRQLFAEHGYTRLDFLRPHLMEEEGLPYWWKQNLFVFTNDESLRPQVIWPVDHGDDVEFVSQKMLNIYRHALTVAYTPLRRRILQAFMRRVHCGKLEK
jgi:hypothetical protein